MINFIINANGVLIIIIEFQPMTIDSKDCAHYHQTKTPIYFLCRWGLNTKSFIQLLKILPIELTRTHQMIIN